MINPLHSTDEATILRIRLMLSEQTALALALLVAADVLDTVIKPSHAYEMNDVIKMGFLTVLRTGVAYFLAREIKELEIVHIENSMKNVSDDNFLIYEQNTFGSRSNDNIASTPRAIKRSTSTSATLAHHTSVQQDNIRKSASMQVLSSSRKNSEDITSNSNSSETAPVLNYNSSSGEDVESYSLNDHNKIVELLNSNINQSEKTKNTNNLVNRKGSSKKSRKQ